MEGKAEWEGELGGRRSDRIAMFWLAGEHASIHTWLGGCLACWGDGRPITSIRLMINEGETGRDGPGSSSGFGCLYLVLALASGSSERVVG